MPCKLCAQQPAGSTRCAFDGPFIASRGCGTLAVLWRALSECARNGHPKVFAFQTAPIGGGESALHHVGFVVDTGDVRAPAEDWPPHIVWLVLNPVTPATDVAGKHQPVHPTAVAGLIALLIDSGGVSVPTEVNVCTLLAYLGRIARSE